MYKEEENGIKSRISQFERDQKKTSPPAKKKPVSISTSINPYLLARLKILSDYPEWRRNEIADLELAVHGQTSLINNRHYDDFVHEVAVLGDSLTSK